MTDSGKKISFSFSKVKKVPSLKNKVNLEPKENKELIDCFDATKGTFSYKGNIRNDQAIKQELVIPLINTNTSTDILKSRIEKKNSNLKKIETNDNSNHEDIADLKDPKSNPKDSYLLKKDLEELAALEILKDVNNTKKEENSNNLVILAGTVSEETSEANIDYDNVPVTEFGLAMLRGMGWKPNSGIGKEPKIVETVSVKPRPKGLGLGAKLNPEKTEDVKKKN